MSLIISSSTKVVLAEMHRACRHGGGIILTVPQHRWLWSRTDEVAHHVRRYHAGELRRKVTSQRRISP
jgi:hypothetical protein